MEEEEEEGEAVLLGSWCRFWVQRVVASPCADGQLVQSAQTCCLTVLCGCCVPAGAVRVQEGGAQARGGACDSHRGGVRCRSSCRCLGRPRRRCACDHGRTAGAGGAADATLRGGRRAAPRRDRTRRHWPWPSGAAGAGALVCVGEGGGGLTWACIWCVFPASVAQHWGPNSACRGHIVLRVVLHASPNNPPNTHTPACRSCAGHGHPRPAPRGCRRPRRR